MHHRKHGLVVLRSLLWAGLWGFCSHGMAAAIVPESIELAKSVPIADVHMHLVGMSLSDHQAQMDRNNVKWGGGVGRASDRSPLPEDVRKMLGNRYFFGLGQEEFSRVFFSAGPKGLVDPSSVAFADMFAVADQMLATRQAYGFGELHIDNSRSFSTHQFARRIKLDNPVLRRIYELANAHGSFVQLHMEGHEENLEDLQRYLTEFPKAKTILSHALPYAKQPELRRLLAAHLNLYVDFSRKGSVLNDKEAAQAFRRDVGPKDNWLKTIEQFPDRFMVGSDTHAPDERRYDEVMSEYRAGLFPYLRPETVKKVAFENAVRVFGLK
jgi:hypothetical protein